MLSWRRVASISLVLAFAVLLAAGEFLFNRPRVEAPLARETRDVEPAASQLAARVDLTFDPEVEGGPIVHHLSAGDLASLPPIMVQHQGDTLFRAMFTRRRGADSPPLQAAVSPSLPRLSGPESQSCSSCHSQVTTVDGLLLHVPGGAGDNATNTFHQAGVPSDGVRVNIRNTRAVYGSGLKQRLAEEMTADLAALVAEARATATSSGAAQAVALTTKGVSFGALSVSPDGSLDTSAVVGLDADLVVKPFSAKGTVATLREFTEDAAARHLGLPTVATEENTDGALTSADVVALVLWQANRPTPRQTLPPDTARADFARRGQALFGQVGCATCHVPDLPLSNARLDVAPPDSPRRLWVDLAALGPRVATDGPLPVALYSDLKRHDLGPDLAEPLPQAGVAPEQFLTAPLWGVASTGPWLHDGRATTLSEAIAWHSGEAEAARTAFAALPRADQRALIEFLRTLVIEPYPTDLPRP